MTNPLRVLASGRTRLMPVVALALAALFAACDPDTTDRGEAGPARDAVEALVHAHARAWTTGDTALLRTIVHDDAVIAWPRRRVGKEEWIDELAAFRETTVDTRVYVHRIIVDGSRFAVEWQFATTERGGSGARTAVGDAIIGEVRDGRIVLWKEYLDGRLFGLQRSGELPLDEGLEPFPWPRVP